jgi:hypothetical protein
MSHQETMGTRRRRPKSLFFVLFVVVYAIALLPPIYIWLGGLTQAFLGLPASVWYMFGICLLALAVCGALYRYERSRGELD